MWSSHGKKHFTEALRWQTEAGADWVAIVGAALGMAGPALLGLALGDLPAGFTMALGGLMAAGVNAGESWAEQARMAAATLVPAAAALVLAPLIARNGWWADAGAALLAGLAATIGGFSRPVAFATTRFILMLLIAVAVIERAPEGVPVASLAFAGVAWVIAVSLILGAVARAMRDAPGPIESVAEPPAAARPTLQRWLRGLTHLAAWQYPLRLTLCLAVAAILKSLWPDHHLYWIALTVGLLTDRQIDRFPVKTTQRVIGTALGVLIADVVFRANLPTWALPVAVGVLAGARPLLRVRNYLLYSVLMTLLVVIIMDAGHPPEFGVLIDRLIATLTGAALVITANLIFHYAGANPARAQ